MAQSSAKWFLLAVVIAMLALFRATSMERARDMAVAATDKAVANSAASVNDERNDGAPKAGNAKPGRVAWTTSRVIGSPDPPPPFRTQRVFGKLAFDNPTVIVMPPVMNRLFVCERTGKIFSFREDEPNCEKADLVIDLKQHLRSLMPEGKPRRVGSLYGLAFHPQFAKNRFAYVCYTVNSTTSSEVLLDGTRVSRFVMTDTDPPTLDADSEKILITWQGEGHNGGCLVFGPDGYLYITSGDGSTPNPPDALLAGQDVSRLLSAVLRIDVDREQDGRPYRIPDDNPFVNLPGARGEIWAHGFRNPWKITFDRATGDLWLGDVGWESYELVDRIVKGGNYGWSIVEGLQPVRPDAKRGPTPILPPTIALPHSEAASVTGGYVYRGSRFPELVGKYVFGDWETRRMWAAIWDGEKVTQRTELVEPALRIVCYAENHAGELYVMDYDDGTIHEFARNDVPRDSGDKFPRKLSETGLFAGSKFDPAPGVIPFEINAPMWSDGATAERWLALPDTSSINWHKERIPIPGTIFHRNFVFPANAVLAKTLSIESDRGKPATKRRTETQLLHYDGRHWRGYSYRWNDEQSDADLVSATGDQAEITITERVPVEPSVSRYFVEQGQVRHQEIRGATKAIQRSFTWTFQGRAACFRCHNSWTQHTLAFNLPQLNRQSLRLVHEADKSENQLAHLTQAGVIVPVQGELDPAHTPSLVDPYEDLAPLDERARSYLQANCAHCHQMGGTGTADFDVRFDVAIDKTRLLDRRPLQGAFQLENGQLIAPGDPFRSVLFYRVAHEGQGHMPIIGSETVDDAGVKLLAEWIRQLPLRFDDAALLARLHELDNGDKKNEKPRREVIDKLLSSPIRALMLSRELVERPLSQATQQEVLTLAGKVADPQIKELFERFRPADQRPKRLGTQIRADKLLALSGDAARGREVFFRTTGVTCKSCHKIGNEGGSVGPDLSQVAKKYDKAKLLESLLEPSKFIDPKFVAYLAQTDDGKVVTGLLIEQTTERVVLRNSQGQDVRLALANVEVLLPQRQSLMPELLLKDLTAEQVADLLSFLETLR